jgi:hypothetical protein
MKNRPPKTAKAHNTGKCVGLDRRLIPTTTKEKR